MSLLNKGFPMEFASIRALTVSDIPTVTTLLYNTLDDSLLQKLGKPFIEFHFLPKALKQQGLSNLVYELNDSIVAYLLIAQPESAIKELAKKIKFATLFETLKKITKNPSLILELISGFRNHYSLEEPFELKKASYLVYFAVSSQWQGKGLGTTLLNTCLNELAISHCVVETKSNKAIQFYKKLGFNIIGIRKRFFDDCTLLLRSQ